MQQPASFNILTHHPHTTRRIINGYIRAIIIHHRCIRRIHHGLLVVSRGRNLLIRAVHLIIAVHRGLILRLSTVIALIRHHALGRIHLIRIGLRLLVRGIVHV